MTDDARKKRTRWANLHIRLYPEELDAFKRAADKAALDFTTWVRLSLRKIAGLDQR